MKKLVIAFLSIITISACAKNANIIKTYTPPRFTNQEQIKLNVESINTQSEFSPTFTRPNVEHLLPISIEKTTRIWADDRLEAASPSSSKQAVITIKDASVTEELIKSQKFLQKDQLKYIAKLHVELKVIDENNLSSAQTEIRAWRELIIPADTPLSQKEEYWSSMVEKLFADYNNQMAQNINEYLGQYIIR